MMIGKRALVVMTLLMTVSACSGGEPAVTAPPITSPSSAIACAITVPNDAVPPGEPPAANYFGNGTIWTLLWPDGRVVFKPGGPGTIDPTDGTLSMKWPWWRSVTGVLVISGRRLDAPSRPMGPYDVRAAGYGATGFLPTALAFPSPGCWEVTGKVGSASLTFVTLVVKE